MNLPCANVSVIVLSGGFGTRLRSALADQPKCLAPVCGRAFIDYLLESVAAAGFEHVVLATGYLAGEVQQHCKEGQDWGLKISYSREEEPLGTAGAMRLAEPICRGDIVIVMNGDSHVSVSFEKLLSYHARHQGAATMVLAEVQDRRRFGTVEFERGGRVIRFEEKGGHGAGWVNAGVYALDREVLNSVPEGNVSFEHVTLPSLLSSHDLYALPVESELVDIGTPDSLASAQSYLGFDA